MSVSILPPIQYRHHRSRHSRVPVQQQHQQQQMAYTNSYSHTDEFAHTVPPGSYPPYFRSRQATAYSPPSTELPYLSINSREEPGRFGLGLPVETRYIQRYHGERIEPAHQLPEWRTQCTRRGRHSDQIRSRISRSQPSTAFSSLVPAVSRSLDPSFISPHLRNPQPRTVYLFPFDDSELAAVRSMWFDQGRRGLNIVEGLIRPPSVKHSTDPSVSQQEEQSVEAQSSSSSASTAPSGLFDCTSLSSDTTATSVETIRSPASKMETNKDKGKMKVALGSPSRARTTTALSVNASSDGLSLPRYTVVSPDECPLHAHAQTVLEGLLNEQDRRGPEESLRDTRYHSLSSHKAQAAGYRRRRAQSVSEPNLSTMPLSWLSLVESFVELVGRLPNAYILTTPNLSFHSHTHTQSSPRRRSASLPRKLSASAPVRPSRKTATVTDLDVVDHPPINLLPLPLHPPPPPHVRVIPPIRSLPRSPYRPKNPPATPTPRMRIVPNPQFLRLKALQNRVLWGLVPVERGECEVLRRVGIGIRSAPHGKDGQRGGSGGWPEEIDREGRMCTGREAKVGVAVEGRRRSVLADGDVLTMDESADLSEGFKWWLRMTRNWTGV